MDGVDSSDSTVDSSVEQFFNTEDVTKIKQSQKHANNKFKLIMLIFSYRNGKSFEFLTNNFLQQSLFCSIFQRGVYYLSRQVNAILPLLIYRFNQHISVFPARHSKREFQ